MKKNKTAALFQVIILLLVAVLLLGCSASDTQEDESVSPDLVFIDETTISASAEFAPQEWATLNFLNTAQDVQIYVNPGTTVKRGDLLATSDTTLLKSQLVQAEAVLLKAQVVYDQLNKQPSQEALAAAEAALANAEANYERLDRANARDYELEAAQAQIDSAQIALDVLTEGATIEQTRIARSDIDNAQEAVNQIKTVIEACELLAPFNGTVIELYAKPYEHLAPLQPVLLLADLTSLQLETTDLNEVDVVSLEIGQPVRITIDALPQTELSGSVARIASRVSPGSGVYYRVWIRVPDLPEEIRWGMSAFVEFVSE
jgi:multidrug efflux pump subunit AcrA (membrane-fusion protein)